MIIRDHIWEAVQNDTRIAASLLRLQFHDCIVDVCKVCLYVVVSDNDNDNDVMKLLCSCVVLGM